MIRNELIQGEIKDKIKGYIISQKKVHIKTIPSTTYPNGKFYNGLIINYTKDQKKIIFIDDVEGTIEISIILIVSPDDLGDYKEKKDG